MLPSPFETPWLGGRLGLSLESATRDVNGALRDLWMTVAAPAPDPALEKAVYDGLGIAYGLVGLVALVQLVRIQCRVPEYGWTTQKVFHLLNLVVMAVRSAVFFFWSQVQLLDPVPLKFLLGLPGLLFFTTYMLLVLFWAEIYHQARGLPTETLRPAFRDANIAVYAIQTSLWAAMYFSSANLAVIDVFNKSFFAGVCLAAAVGFLVYGGRLFLMLRRFPIESRGRRKKLHEVGMVTFICFICFTVRACMMAVSAYDPHNHDLDVMGHPWYNAAYYVLVELLPSTLVLFILRKLPPKRNPSSQAVR